jgi:AbrB family looped-hinge helix DNA binding protein
MALHMKIAANGRMILPADIRQRMGLAEGEAVLLEETDDGVVLRTVAQAAARAHALARQYTESHLNAGVDEFLARRRENSGE